MSQSKARNILRRIVPWALDANSSKAEFRSNHKGVRGRIGIVGGARDYAGAPYFASMSAMKLGADLAYVICSSSASPVIKSYSPDLIVTPLMDCADESLFIKETECLLSRLHALVVGPGLGREEFMLKRARGLIESAKARSLPIILDADSLLMVMDDPSLIKSYPKALLTPNRIELQRMLNSLYAPKKFDLKNLTNQEVIELVKQCSSTLGVSILAKGMIDVIYSQAQGSDFHLLIEENLGSSRRCGGQGDILAGLAGVYFHWIEQANNEQRNEKITNPAAWAGYLAALTTRICNRVAYKEFKNGMLASDMVDQIQSAFEELLKFEGSVHQTNSLYSGQLVPDEIRRFARQMIMAEFGPERQLKLKKASAIIVGAGGLGCPSAIYLAAGGIGRLGIVDNDRVEVSNLHRQILHNLAKVNMLKTESIKESILAINPNVKVDTYPVRMTRENAVKLIEEYDMVIDASDNLMTRYMISDACIVAKKPLISGAALKMDGQLTVYNYDKDSPCFRCLFPVPPPAAGVGSCSENGVLGVIPGVIGVQQALEAIKFGDGLKPASAGKMLLFDGELGLFRNIKLISRRQDCAACGPNSKLDRSLIDYDEFCSESVCKKNPTASTDILSSQERITNQEYRQILDSKVPHVLVDVRPKSHSDISRFSHALQIPVADLLNDQEKAYRMIKSELDDKMTNSIYVVCRRGIASQRGTRIIQDLFKAQEETTPPIVRDIIGGMTGWSSSIDPEYSCV